MSAFGSFTDKRQRRIWGGKRTSVVPIHGPIDRPANKQQSGGECDHERCYWYDQRIKFPTELKPLISDSCQPNSDQQDDEQPVDSLQALPRCLASLTVIHVDRVSQGLDVRNRVACRPAAATHMGWKADVGICSRFNWTGGFLAPLVCRAL